MLQLFGITQDNGKRSPDVMGDPGNPVYAGFLPFGKECIFVEHGFRSLVKVLPDVTEDSLFGQVDFLFIPQIIDCRSYGL